MSLLQDTEVSCKNSKSAVLCL